MTLKDSFVLCLSGLDANTALAYAQVMRDLADISKTSIVVSLYQAGNRVGPFLLK